MPKQIKTTTGAINPVKVMPKRIKTTLLHTPPTMCCNGLPYKRDPITHMRVGEELPLSNPAWTPPSRARLPPSSWCGVPSCPAVPPDGQPGCQRSWGSSHAVGSTQQCVTTNNHHNRIRASCAVNMFLYIDIIIKLYLYIYIL